MSRRIEYSYGLGEDSPPEEAAAVTPSGQPTNSSSWADALKAAVPALTSVYQQAQLTKINTQRMQQGLPPFTAAQYSTYFQPPAATVQVGMSPQTQNLLIYGGLAAAALFLATRHR